MDFDENGLGLVANPLKTPVFFVSGEFVPLEAANVIMTLYQFAVFSDIGNNFAGRLYLY